MTQDELAKRAEAIAAEIVRHKAERARHDEMIDELVMEPVRLLGGDSAPRSLTPGRATTDSIIRALQEESGLTRGELATRLRVHGDDRDRMSRLLSHLRSKNRIVRSEDGRWSVQKGS